MSERKTFICDCCKEEFDTNLGLKLRINIKRISSFSDKNSKAAKFFNIKNEIDLCEECAILFEKFLNDDKDEDSVDIML